MNFKYIIIAFEVIIIYLLLCRSDKIEKFTNGGGLNSFDRYYYINLTKRKDRKKQILNEMKKIDIPNEKIERIDASYEKYNGHLGCVKSHIKALENAKKNNYETVVIFEDDFIFTKDKDTIDNKLNEFLDKKNNKWDVLQIGASYTKTEDTDIEDIKNVNSAMTSSGYIINNNFYDTLLSNFYESRDKLQKMTDLHLQTSKTKIHAPGKIALDQYWQPLQEKSNWYLYDIGTQGGDAGHSSIMGGLESNKKDITLNKKQELFKEALEDMDDIFKKNNIKFFLYCGTALGAHREKKFIEHDPDIDLGVFKNINLIKLSDIINKSKIFKVILSFPLNETKNITEISCMHLKTNVKVDIFQVFKIKNNKYIHYTYTGICDDKKNKRCEYINSFKLETIKFLDRHYKVPNIDFLISNYGKDWNIVKKYSYNEGLAGHYKSLQ